MKRRNCIVVVLALTAVAAGLRLSAATYHVDCRNGSDANDGLSAGSSFKTLKKATSMLKAGDVLELAPGAKFHESLVLVSSGTPASPIVVHGNGAVLSGLAPVPDDSWKEMDGGLWLSANKVKSGALMPRVVDRAGAWRSVSCFSPSKVKPDSLKPGESIWKDEGIWFRPEDGRRPQDYGLQGFYSESGLKIDGKSYVTVENLVCENFANDGFNVHGICAGLVFRNIVGRYNGDDGFSVHEDVQANVYGGCFHHNDYGIQDICASQSSFCGVTVVSNRLHGIDLLGGLRVIRDSVVRDNSSGQIRIRGHVAPHMGWDKGNPLFRSRAYLEHVAVGPGDGAALAVWSDAGVTAHGCEFTGTDFGADVSGDGMLHLVKTKIHGCRKGSVRRTRDTDVVAKDCEINPQMAPLPPPPRPVHAVTKTDLVTTWGAKVTADNAWREYPRPQMERADWTCLNGKWRYAITSTTNTFARPSKWAGSVLVPFAIESKLSGVGRALAPDEFLWYQRSFAVSGRRAGERVLLHFECADWRTQVWIGDVEVTDAPHEGGNVPFSLDVTDFVREGENLLTVLVWDPTETFLGATGKQALNPSGCHYTRSSGLVGSVWMERVPQTHLVGWRATPDMSDGAVEIRLDVAGNMAAASAELVVSRGGAAVARASTGNVANPVRIPLPKPVAAWSPDSPALYDIAICVKDRDAGTVDEVKGYFGMRSFEWKLDENGIPRFYLNGRKTYVMATLDQGWWPDGLLTPPSDDAMAYDVSVLKKCGFNAVRKHIKVEPRRYYHMCDRLGMMVLQDMPSGRWLGKLHGLLDDMTPRYGQFRAELKAMVDHLANSPSIVMWVPYNEGWGQTCALHTSATLRWLKRYDPTRLVDGPSGWNDFEGGSTYVGWYTPMAAVEPDIDFSADILDIHKYPGPVMPTVGKRRVAFLGEFGGLAWRIDGHLWSKTAKNWGYDGNLGEDKTAVYLGMMKKLEDFAARGLAGSVYTQTTDVEIEINGIITYDRKVVKYDPAVLRAAHEKVMRAAGAEPVTCGSAAAGATPADALRDILPRPVKTELREGEVSASRAMSSVKTVRGAVPGAPARTADEAYRLEIGGEGVVVTAASEKGERYALTTLRQLAKLAGGEMLPQCVITDWPRFPMRGLMLDCGRNYQSLDQLRAVVDHLSAYKLNVFHWHLTDYYGWRLESKVHPELQSPKSFGRQTGKYYTQREFADLVEYAARLGVVVIPELDVPGHTLAFRRAFGIERMNTPGVREIVLDLIDELCSLVPPEKMPYVHLGTDEVDQKLKAGTENVPAEWLAAWAQRVSDRGRTLMGWMPGERLNPTGPSIHEYWWFTPTEFFRDFLPEAGSHAYVDSTDMCYINHVDPLALLAGAAYTQPCRWGEREDFRIGALISSWHDNRILNDSDLPRTNPLFPSVVLFCDSFWRGRDKDEPGLLSRLPSPDDPRFAAAADLERSVAAQRDKVLEGLRWPFAFVRQTHMRWRMTDAATGKVIARNIPQGTIYPYFGFFPVDAYVPEGRGRVFLDTWIHSPCEMRVGAWIGFTGFSRSGGRGGRVPPLGLWSTSGATAELNGERIEPPKWDNPNLHGKGAYEVPHTNEDWFYRPPVPIRLKKGWNHVHLDVPSPKGGDNKWVATFVPVVGDTFHPREVPGLRYSDEAP